MKVEDGSIMEVVRPRRMSSVIAIFKRSAVRCTYMLALLYLTPIVKEYASRVGQVIFRAKRLDGFP